MTFEQQAFVTGYHHGSLAYANGQEGPSPRDVQERFPKWRASQVDCYLNGYDDAQRCDSWRFSQIMSAASRERRGL